MADVVNIVHSIVHSVQGRRQDSSSIGPKRISGGIKHKVDILLGGSLGLQAVRLRIWDIFWFN